MFQPQQSANEKTCCAKGTTRGNTLASVVLILEKTYLQLWTPQGPLWVTKMPPGASFLATTSR